MSYPNFLFVTQLKSLEARRNNLSISFFQDICKPTTCLHHLIPPPRDTSVTTPHISPSTYVHMCTLFVSFAIFSIISTAYHLLSGCRAARFLLNWLIDWLIDWLTKKLSEDCLEASHRRDWDLLSLKWPRVVISEWLFNYLLVLWWIYSMQLYKKKLSIALCLIHRSKQ